MLSGPIRCSAIDFLVQQLYIAYTVNVLNFRTLSNKMLVSSPGTRKMLVRIANSEDQDQTASEEAV